MAELPDLVPIRMLNEYAYCPRLFWLEWVDRDFRDSVDTVDGRFQHRRVDRPGGAVPDAEDAAGAPFKARSVELSSERLGLITKIDVIEGADGIATPVDYKRGSSPDVEEVAWEPERVQVCAQALVLRDNGYRCEEGAIYYVAAKRRVPVVLDDRLVERTLELLEQLRATATRPHPPSPLIDSPKCPRCSLVGICLPDEVNTLAAGAPPTADDDAAEPPQEHEVRRLVPARDDALPLYVQSPRARVSRKGEELVVEIAGEDAVTARLIEVSQLALFGGGSITTPCLIELMRREIPVAFFSTGGWFQGLAQGLPHKNVALRQAQYRAADDLDRCLALARRLVAAKVRNCRTFLRRNHPDLPPEVPERLTDWIRRSGKAETLESLLGMEGNAARIYFGALPDLLRPREAGAESGTLAFDFEGRNRRPPKDPVNAMLSLLYAVLTKDLTVTITAVGLDPYLGFYHQPRYGRPALALDLMEEFRPLLADSTVVTAVNTGVVGHGDFTRRAGAVALTPSARRALLGAYERRLDQLVTHPVFGYRISYRRVLEVQARLLARHLLGEIPEYPSFVTR